MAAFEEILQISDSEEERAIAAAEIAEMHLLQGELGKLEIDGGTTC